MENLFFSAKDAKKREKIILESMRRRQRMNWRHAHAPSRPTSRFFASFADKQIRVLRG